jgi:RNA polymerase sigma-70 factor (ECF subfamily)
LVTTLAHELAAGDAGAFAALYDRLAVRLLNTARTMTASAALAEDLVHDVFAELVVHRHRLAAVTDLDAYVFTMLRHAVSRVRRRAAIDRRARAAVLASRTAEGRLADRPVDVPDDGLEAAIAALPADQREVVALKIDGGLTFQEIAAVTGVSANTAASRYRYALEKLRTRLQPPGDDP